MSAELEQIRESMAAYLTGKGVTAVTAWPDGARTWGDGPAAVVSLRSCQAAGSGLGDYLGRRYDEESGAWQELYGKRLEVVLGLDLWAAGAEGARRIQESFEALLQALHEGAPEGLKVREVTCGETEYSQASGLMVRRVQMVCTAHLYAAAEEGATFLNFEIRGEWNG